MPSPSKKNENNDAGRGPNVIRTKAKPKVNPVTGANFEYVNEPRIGDSFVVCLAGPGGVQSFTFHHPIGVTDVDGEDWVCTPTGDIPSLLARQADPDEADRKAKRDKHRLDLCVRAGLLKQPVTDGPLVYPDTEINRQDALAKARAEAKDAIKAEKGKPPPDLYVRFLPVEVQELEVAVRDFLASPATIQAAETKFPPSGYRTRGGHLADRDQEAVSYLTGKSRPQASDAVTKRIFGLDDDDEN
jgi:hypothetical protein